MGHGIRGEPGSTRLAGREGPRAARLGRQPQGSMPEGRTLPPFKGKGKFKDSFLASDQGPSRRAHISVFSPAPWSIQTRGGRSDELDHRWLQLHHTIDLPDASRVLGRRRAAEKTRRWSCQHPDAHTWGGTRNRLCGLGPLAGIHHGMLQGLQANEGIGYADSAPPSLLGALESLDHRMSSEVDPDKMPLCLGRLACCLGHRS